MLVRGGVLSGVCHHGATTMIYAVAVTKDGVIRGRFKIVKAEDGLYWRCLEVISRHPGFSSRLIHDWKPGGKVLRFLIRGYEVTQQQLTDLANP